MRRSTTRAVAASCTALALLLTACGTADDDGTDATDGTDAAAADGDDASGTDAQAADEELAVAIAGYDLAVGDQQRLIAGVLSADAVQLGFGEVEFQLGYLGDEPGGEAELTGGLVASYLPVLGIEPEGESEDPTLLVGSSGTGVYQARADFAEPGWYGLRVVADLDDGTTRSGQTTFEVLPEAEVPQVGEDAPRSENLTIADVEAGDATPVSVDSRALDGDEVPDPQLHDTTVAEAIDAGRPAVVILSTPTYCVSAFCGPLTEELATFATEREDAAEFIHIEVWRDFEANELNDAAAEWIQTSSGGNEPWVFLVDGDGVIQARWDNVVDIEELEAGLEAVA
jgi:hypothetical protein